MYMDHTAHWQRYLYTGVVQVSQLCPADLKLEQEVVSALANFARVHDADFQMDSFLEEFFSGIEEVN